jgi:hypothetical protein
MRRALAFLPDCGRGLSRPVCRTGRTSFASFIRAGRTRGCRTGSYRRARGVSPRSSRGAPHELARHGDEDGDGHSERHRLLPGGQARLATSEGQVQAGSVRRLGQEGCGGSTSGMPDQTSSAAVRSNPRYQARSSFLGTVHGRSGGLRPPSEPCASTVAAFIGHARHLVARTGAGLIGW